MIQRVLAAAVLVSACAQPAAPPAKAPSELTLTQVWSTQGLANPESIVASADGAFFYLSNVNGEGEAKDGNGFISRLSPDGVVLQREWAKGLDAPKGLALHAGRLFASDIDRIVEIDAATGAIRARHAAPDAKFLNDVAIAPDGAVLASDSGSARIYALKDGVTSVWLANDALKSINGLLPEPERLVATTMEGKLLAIDWASKAVTPLADDLGQADGVAPLRDGAYLVGEWPGRLFEVKADGAHRVLLDTRAATVLLNDFLLVDDTLYVPNWEPGAVTAYRVTR